MIKNNGGGAMAKGKNKRAKRRLVIFGSLSIVAILYFVTTLFSYTTNIKNLKNQEKNLNSELNSLKRDSEILRTEIEKLKDPEYIARFAREEYSYSKQNGEIIIKINDKEQETQEEVVENNNMNTYLIFGIGAVLVGIIIYIIKK